MRVKPGDSLQERRDRIARVLEEWHLQRHSDPEEDQGREGGQGREEDQGRRAVFPLHVGTNVLATQPHRTSLA
eukprot:1401507-Pyramimonas_sp.AAC.1